jgi:hypothetical protein
MTIHMSLSIEILSSKEKRFRWLPCIVFWCRFGESMQGVLFSFNQKPNFSRRYFGKSGVFYFEKLDGYKNKAFLLSDETIKGKKV